MVSSDRAEGFRGRNPRIPLSVSPLASLLFGNPYPLMTLFVRAHLSLLSPQHPETVIFIAWKMKSGPHVWYLRRLQCASVIFTSVHRCLASTSNTSIRSVSLCDKCLSNARHVSFLPVDSHCCVLGLNAETVEREERG